MKRLLFVASCLLFFGSSFSQSHSSDNTLLWRVSGKDLAKPTYIFGTIHLICADDLQISDSLGAAIAKSDQVYLELDMDNMFELMSVAAKMKMNGDTTLADLLEPEEYKKVKSFFDRQRGLIPFALLEKYKPMLAASTLMQSEINCDNAIAMEQLVMRESKLQKKQVKGLETMSFQMGIFDSIPYQVQARQLLQYVNDFESKKDSKDYDELLQAYRNQQLAKMEEITRKEDPGMERFTEIILYDRNKDWVKKLERLMPEHSLVVAVGAGHLPGERGVLNLLRQSGYKVEPVRNNMIKLKDQKHL